MRVLSLNNNLSLISSATSFQIAPINYWPRLRTQQKKDARRHTAGEQTNYWYYDNNTVFLKIMSPTQIRRTETIDNTSNPDFVKKFTMDYYFEKKQHLKFDL